MTAEKYNTPITASLNPIMVDGTGMCGCCRVEVDGKTKFTCVDGPDFDAPPRSTGMTFARVRPRTAPRGQGL